MSSPSTPQFCAKCGTNLIPGTADSLCLDCLLEDGIETKAGTIRVFPQTTEDETVPLLASGARIGRYKILEQLGEGGFGVVYLAEQEEPIRRRVALKIIKLGLLRLANNG